MSIPLIISANGRQYRVVEDSVFIQLALVQGLIRDAVTGLAPSTSVVVETDNAYLSARTEQKRWFGVSGRADLAFPNLSSQSDVLNLTVRAPGYRSVQFSLVIPQNAVFPISAPDVVLNREPVSLVGRVTTADTNRAPIEEAFVRAVDPIGPPPAERIHLLRSPVQIDRSMGTTAQSRALNPVAFVGERTLISRATAGARSMLVSNRQGLAPDQILRLGSERDGEYAVIDSISALPADLSWPGLVIVRGGLQRAFPEQTAFQVFTAGAGGPPHSLLRSVFSGTSVLVLDGVVGSGVLELTAPGQTPEYHLIGALTDAAGYYQIRGVGSVSLLHLDASATGFNPLAEPVRWMVQYDQPLNHVDFRLAP
jgi:hypothetical protein